MMDSSINNGICRCCASEGTFKDMKTSYHWMGDVEIYSEMLKECFDISLISADNGEEGGVCEVCITQLRNASNFKKQVQHTEEQFKLRLQGKLFKSDIVKIEPAKEDDYGNDSDHLESEDFSGPEFEVPIKTESVEEAKPKKRAAAAKATTSRAKKAKTSEGETSTKRAQRKVNVDTTNDETGEGSGTEEQWSLVKHRANLKEILLCSNATPLLSTLLSQPIKYNCCFCKDEFPHPADVKRHTIDAHDDLAKAKFASIRDVRKLRVKLDITSLSCKICEGRFDMLDQLIQHLDYVHNKKVFTDAMKFILPFKFDSEEHRCCICTSVMISFGQLLKHMNGHYRNPSQHTPKCGVCDKTYSDNYALRNHVRKVHIMEKSHKCTECDMCFSSRGALSKHMLKHTNIRQFHCKVCPKSFKTKCALVVHMRIHLNDRRFKCEHCGQAFVEKAGWKSHMWTRHREEIH